MILEAVALILLTLRLISVWFSGVVVAKQFALLRKTTAKDGLSELRLVMLLMGVAILLMNILPILVDVYYAFVHADASWNTVLVSYATNNAVGWFFSSLLLWKIYKIASGDDKQDSV